MYLSVKNRYVTQSFEDPWHIHLSDNVIFFVNGGHLWQLCKELNKSIVDINFFPVAMIWTINFKTQETHLSWTPFKKKYFIWFNYSQKYLKYHLKYSLFLFGKVFDACFATITHLHIYYVLVLYSQLYTCYYKFVK